jgi:hypothetical protein
MYYGKPSYIGNLNEYSDHGVRFRLGDKVEIFRGIKNVGVHGILSSIKQYKEFIGITIDTDNGEIIMSYIKNIVKITGNPTENLDFSPDLFRIE